MRWLVTTGKGPCRRVITASKTSFPPALDVERVLAGEDGQLPEVAAELVGQRRVRHPRALRGFRLVSQQPRNPTPSGRGRGRARRGRALGRQAARAPRQEVELPGRVGGRLDGSDGRHGGSGWRGGATGRRRRGRRPRGPRGGSRAPPAGRGRSWWARGRPGAWARASRTPAPRARSTISSSKLHRWSVTFAAIAGVSRMPFGIWHRFRNT